ncbi:MAG: M48 family metallopeptidase [bacterium]
MILFAGMALLLAVLGYAVGSAFDARQGGIIGLVLAIALWMALTLISVNSGDQILLKVSRAREVTKDVHPRLFNVVEEMKIAAGLPGMPKVYIIDDPAPNAFAIGIKPEKSAVAVTAGLVEKLNRDELQGVVAHEVSHIMNRDSQLMTVAGIMLGSIVIIAEFFLRSMWFMPSSSRRYRKGSGGGDPRLQLIMVVVAIALAILAPIFARLLYLAVSRKREYLADATAAQLTRYPEGLASALEKISSSPLSLESANKVTAPMYIVNPLVKKDMKLSSLGSTHPPTEQRIKILRTMAGGADYRSYQRAFSKVTKSHSAVIPTSGLRGTKRVEARAASSDETDVKGAKKSTRDVMDLMRAVNGYAFLVCACGLKIKLPPELAKPSIKCPKCGRENKVPGAELAAVGAVVGAVSGAGRVAGDGGVDGGTGAEAGPGPGGRYEYHRKGDGWETFACACGNRLQLSPAFSGTMISCRKCGRNITIKQ